MCVEKWKQVYFLHYYNRSFEVKHQQFSALSFSWNYFSRTQWKTLKIASIITVFAVRTVQCFSIL